MAAVLCPGSGTQARCATPPPSVVQAARFARSRLDTVMQSQNVAAAGPPRIVPVMEFRATTGTARTHMSAGGDPANKPRQAPACRPLRGRLNAR